MSLASPASPALPALPLTPVRDPAKSRISRLRAFEILIFVLMAILLALCLAAVPVVSKREMPVKGGAEKTPALRARSSPKGCLPVY